MHGVWCVTVMCVVYGEHGNNPGKSMATAWQEYGSTNMASLARCSVYGVSGKKGGQTVRSCWIRRGSTGASPNDNDIRVWDRNGEPTLTKNFENLENPGKCKKNPW